MVKRIIAMTATAVCTLAVSASAAESTDNSAPPAPPADSAQVELAPQVLALHAVDSAKLDEAAARIEAAIEKLRAAGELEGVNKDELIAQLQAAADSLKAGEPQIVELKDKLGVLQGLDTQKLLELRQLAPGDAPQVYQLDPKAIEELKNNALILKDRALKFKQFAPGDSAQVYQPLSPEQLEELKALPEQLHYFYAPQAQGIDPKRLKELEELRTYENGDNAPHATVFTPEQLEQMKQTYNVFTPEQLEELKALGEADAKAGHPGWVPVDPSLHDQIMQEVQAHQLTKEQVAELHQKIQALVEQYIEEHAADADSNNDSPAEDSEE